MLNLYTYDVNTFETLQITYANFVSSFDH